MSTIPKAFLDELRARVSVSALVGKVVKLRRAGNEWTGLCPFHKERNPSFTVSDSKGFYHCFGCQAHGDAIRWLVDYEGMSFVAAVAELAAMAGLSVPGAAGADAQSDPSSRSAPVQRESVRPVQERPVVASIDMAREIWRRCHNGGAGQPKFPVETYLRARGVPAEVLRRPGVMDDLLFCPQAPLRAWDVERGVDSVPTGPAMCAVIRRNPLPDMTERTICDWQVIGLHVTYLSDDFTAKATRKSRSGADLPARKMLGDVQGGCVILGRFRSGTRADDCAPLAVGEGVETVLSALAGMAADTCGLAALSLDNLQGFPVRDARGALPVWNLVPDLERSALRFRHGGPVTILCDADMKPLRVATNRRGEPISPKVAERARGPFVIREIGQAERADICGRLAVAGWRAMGCADVKAVRPQMGCDFNDQVRGAARWRSQR